MRHLAVIVLLASARAAAADSSVTGDYLEDRSGRIYGCPCEWSSEFVSNGREAVLAWKIRSGSFGGHSLAGLQLAAVVTSDFNVAAPWALRRSMIFVDSSAPGPQRVAGERWLRSRYGDTVGRVIGVRAAPVKIEILSETARVIVGDVLTVQMRLARLEDDTQPWADLLYDPLIRLLNARMATSLENRYASPDREIRWDRRDASINGYFGTFETR